MADQHVLDVETILQVARTWPRDQQVQLARALLDQPFDLHGDLGLATLDPLTGRPYVASADLRGIGTGGRPAPSDEEIERWRLEKYGE